MNIKFKYLPNKKFQGIQKTTAELWHSASLHYTTIQPLFFESLN